MSYTYLLDNASPSATPADTEAVKLGASRIRTLKDDLQAILAAIFNNDRTFRTNAVPGTALTNTSLTAAQVANATLTPVQMAASAQPVLGITKNFTATNNAATPDTKIDVAADEVVLKDGGGVSYLAALSGGATINCAGTGANGLDAGALGNSTFYYLWIIYNGTTVAGLASLSSTAPTMPGGYTYKALVGVVRTDGAAHFIKSYQAGREIFFEEQNVFTAQSPAVINTYQIVSLASYIPSIAKIVSGTIGIIAGAESGNAGLTVAADANNLGALTVMINTNGTGSASNGFLVGGSFRLPMKTAQNIYWKATTLTAAKRLSVSGYVI